MRRPLPSCSPRVPAPREPRQHGFTAVELLVVIAIVGILAALAGPSFVPIIERYRVRQAVEEMTSTIYYARSEAIKRGGNITILKTTLSTDCPQASGAAAWSCGWQVFVDTNNDGVLQNTEEPLKVFPPSPSINVVNTSSATQQLFKVDRWGQLNGLGADGFNFTPVNGGNSSRYAVTLCISAGGSLQKKNGVVTC